MILVAADMEKPSAPPLIAPITCGPDNVREFNAALRAHLPGAPELIKAFMSAGLMEGLRGVEIGPLGSLQTGVQPVLPLEAEKRLQGHQSK